eukprot:TRINITY_DN18253_c0_g1_i2.p1 TRINITY_DN18253_c0_g1~~TRINITY_DN18253_c0_g1_i2.p1  ORF type:complete len:268 (+),score=30.88 TRINITY_DN18253_c0_g1_i2:98-901(+)
MPPESARSRRSKSSASLAGYHGRAATPRGGSAAAPRVAASTPRAGRSPVAEAARSASQRSLRNAHAMQPADRAPAGNHRPQMHEPQPDRCLASCLQTSKDGPRWMVETKSFHIAEASGGLTSVLQVAPQRLESPQERNQRPTTLVTAAGHRPPCYTKQPHAPGSVSGLLWHCSDSAPSFMTESTAKRIAGGGGTRHTKPGPPAVLRYGWQWKADVNSPRAFADRPKTVPQQKEGPGCIHGAGNSRRYHESIYKDTFRAPSALAHASA